MPQLTPDDELAKYMEIITPVPQKDSAESLQKLREILDETHVETYYERLPFDSISNDKLRGEFENASTLKGIDGRIRRLRMVQNMRAFCATDKATTTTICFKISRSGTSTNYAYLHVPLSPPNQMLRRLVSLGPTYQSMDGEYRSRCMPYTKVIMELERYREFVEPIEVYFLNLLAKNKISFQTDFHFPDSASSADRQNLYDEVEQYRLPLKFWIATWVAQFPPIHHGLEENHINDAFLKVVDHAADADKILPQLDAVRITTLANLLTYQQYLPNVYGLPRVGQKLIPMTVYEIIKIDDINFGAWRELYINNMLSNLVLNGVSPSFPFITGWHLIQNSHAGLFENQSMHNKFEDSKIVEAVSQRLREIDKHNYFDETISEGPRSNKFMRLSKRIQDSIIYADSAIKLTNLTFCMFQEHIGRTIADYAIITGTADVEPVVAETLADKYLFDKLIFEFIYGFYCMNSRCGIVHGDLHLNNATIFAVLTFGQSRGLYDKPATAYSLDGDSIYIFPEAGVCAGIIDSSRSILGDIDRLNNEFGERFTELFLKDQRFRVMQIIYSYFPKFMTVHRAKMELLIDRNYPLLFKILTAVDTFVLCGNWAKLLAASSDEVRNATATTARSILLRVSRLAESLIISNIQAAIDGELTSAADIEWPNLLILRECFAEYKTSDVGEYELIEWYAAYADMPWDAEDFDTQGELLSPMTEINIRKKLGMTPYSRYYRYVEQLQSQEQAETLDNIIAEYETREDEDLIRFESWMMV